MSKCGICGGGIANTITPHGALCDDDKKAQPMAYAPEIDDLIKMIEEGEIA